MEWWNCLKEWMLESGVWSGFLANALWGFGGGMFVLLIGAYRKDRRRFAGRWQVTIRWTDEWGSHLLGKSSSNLYSNGDVSLAYGIGERQRQYYGLGYFQLWDGMTQYSHLCVRIFGVQTGRQLLSSRFPFFAVCAIRQWNLESLIREKLKRFKYAPFAQYRMKFTQCDGDRMEGNMMVVDGAGEKTVGLIEMDRLV